MEGLHFREGMACLHEAAEAEDGVVEAALLDVLLRAGLDLHQGHLRVPLCIVDAEEDVPLDAHGLRGHLNLVGTMSELLHTDTSALMGTSGPCMHCAACLAMLKAMHGQSTAACA